MTDVSPLLLTANDAGGAGTATRRIHEGLQEIGVHSQMVVRRKSTDNPETYGPTTKLAKAIAKIRPHLDSAPLRFYDTSGVFSLNWIPDRLPKWISRFDPDIIHLNWVAGGYMDLSSISEFQVPLVWRLPDMWPLTGGCHYAGDCTRYTESCGQCPKLESNRSIDPSWITLRRKKRAVERANVTVVATTQWLADAAKESAIFQNCPVTVIPNGLNTDVFQPYDTGIGRELFDISSDARVILFGAVSPVSNPRKGYDLLRQALDSLSISNEDNVELVIFGSQSSDTPEFDFSTHYTGYLHDEESLALLYSTADLMIVPSRYEGFGQTVTEAMACGTPVVAFDTTGPGEIIDHEKTGYLASPYDTNDLSRGIELLLEKPTLRKRLSNNAREEVCANYDITDIAKEYYQLYTRILSDNS